MANKFSTLQTQRPILAPFLRQSVNLLQLPIGDLTMAIEQELQNNPLLELDERGAEPVPDIAKDEEAHQSLDQFSKSDDESPETGFRSGDTVDERPITRDLTLEDHLLRQLQFEVSDEMQLHIGKLIIGSIDEDGYLKISCEEISGLVGAQDLNLIEQVLSLIQSFEPIGIASRNLEECLLTQLKFKKTDHPIAVRMVSEHLGDLGKKKYPEIARKLGIPLEDVKNLAHFIASLDPKPARNYRPVNSSIYIKPDVFIAQDPTEGYQISVNNAGINRLRINSYYKNLLTRTNLKEDERNFIVQKMESASQFIKSVELRGQTIRKIAEYILEKQKGFFDGSYLSLTPLTLNDVATAIKRDESTISRAIKDKYIDTPQGLFPIKFFFSQSIATTENGSTCAQSIKEEIKELVEDENKSGTLSDQDIQRHFEAKGIHIARRTINKYRQALKILPSHLRKE